ERMRMAHELRALVYQGVETMIRQARKARRDLEEGLPRVSEEIESIESGGRRTLVEMRRLLLILRRSETRHFGRREMIFPDGGSQAATRRVRSADDLG